jgi:exfoliative toxin A/B
MSKKHPFLSAVPTPTAGLALGISGLGLCLENVIPGPHIPQIAGAAISGVLLILVALKFLMHPRLLKEDLMHPVIGGIAAAFSEALMVFADAVMVVSKTLGALSLLLGQIVWLTAIFIHAILLITFLTHRLRNFELSHMVPTWFLPTVGSLVAVMTFPGGTALLPLAHGILVFGLISTFLLLPIMMYRLIFGPEIPDAAKPTIAILAAPASLSLAAYLTIAAHPSVNLVALLFGSATLITFLIYVSFFRLLRLPFSPGYAAYTFPIVVSATALFKMVAWMKHTSVHSVYAEQILYLAKFEIVIGALMVLYVAIRYGQHFYGLIRQHFSSQH